MTEHDADTYRAMRAADPAMQSLDEVLRESDRISRLISRQRQRQDRPIALRIVGYPDALVAPPAWAAKWYWCVHVPAPAGREDEPCAPDHPMYRRRIVHDGWENDWHVALGKGLLCLGEEPPVVPKPADPDGINLGPRRRPIDEAGTARSVAGSIAASHRYDDAGNLIYCSLGYPDTQHGGDPDQWCPGIAYEYEDSRIAYTPDRHIVGVHTTAWGKPWHKRYPLQPLDNQPPSITHCPYGCDLRYYASTHADDCPLRQTPPPATPTLPALLCLTCWPATPMQPGPYGSYLCPRCGDTSGSATPPTLTAQDKGQAT